MKLPKRAVTVAVAGAVSLAGLGVVAATTPLGAVAASEPSSEASAAPTIGDWLGAIKDALKSLVTDGTITQEQADKVATTLNESPALGRGGPGHGDHGGFGGHGRGFGGHGGGFGLDAAAGALGMTDQELRTALHEGKTLAEIAEAEGVEVDTLVDALVAAATERAKQAVTDGRLTQERADELLAGLPERIGTAVQEGFGGRGFGERGGHGGPGGPFGPDGPGETAPGQTPDAPSDAPSDAPTDAPTDAPSEGGASVPS